MLPTIMMLKAKVDLHEGTPLGPLRLANQMHPRLARGAIGLEGVAGNTRADNIFPRSWPATVARNHMVKVQIFSLIFLPAILAGIAVALENIVAGGFDFLLRKAIAGDQQDHPPPPNSKGSGW